MRSVVLTSVRTNTREPCVRFYRPRLRPPAPVRVRPTAELLPHELELSASERASEERWSGRAAGT